MIIHVVKPGDTLYAISRRYGVSSSLIIRDNEFQNPNRLVVGQTVVIMEGTRRHQVTSGQSLYSIAKIYGVSVQDILTANPKLSPSGLIYPGTILNIPPKAAKLGTIEVNGYTFTSINTDTLRKTLPNLTYLSIFSNEVKSDGTIRFINDVPLIQTARAANVAPLMVITNIKEGGGFSSDIARSILTNSRIQDNLIDNILSNLRSKNYYGLDIDFEYIYPENREDYNNFLRKVTSKLGAAGYPVTTALAPKIAAGQKGLLYEAHDYPIHGALVNHIILMTYEWGYTYGPPLAVAPINEVRKVLDYAVTAIPTKKIFMGIPNYGYDWTLPYRQGTAASVLSNVGAVNLAASEGTQIKYDFKSQAPFFNYSDMQGRGHVVWFEDARSIAAKLRTVNEYRLGGISYWTIGRYFPQNWLVLQSLYNVRKVI